MKGMEISVAVALALAGGFAVAQDADTPNFSPDGGASTAAAQRSNEAARTLDEEVQDLKKLTVDLNRDLFLLEEELLFP